MRPRSRRPLRRGDAATADACLGLALASARMRALGGSNETAIRGMHLTGCMMCNIWWSADGKKVRLYEEDLRALHDLRRT